MKVKIKSNHIKGIILKNNCTFKKDVLLKFFSLLLACHYVVAQWTLAMTTECWKLKSKNKNEAIKKLSQKTSS